ncbi:unnamed protein product [Strongylus vulgaris]|uniref:Uncharacterized protein n=1 Tax=Strongylus vulgaris TaxID=40348 RepID=A0A3P7JT75_STRVU|nr:unnamed protein product [Strongylus vulgaris]
MYGHLELTALPFAICPSFGRVRRYHGGIRATGPNGMHPRQPGFGQGGMRPGQPGFEHGRFPPGMSGPREMQLKGGERKSSRT